MLASKAVRTGLIALAMAGLMTPVLVDLARADAECVAAGGGGVKKGRIKYQYCSLAPTTVTQTFAPGPPASNYTLTVANFFGDCDADGGPDMFIGSVSYDYTTNTASAYAKPFGTTKGGGLTTQSLPTDTLSACVGFYSPGVPPPDSMVAVGIARNPTNVTLTFQQGGLQARMPGGRETSIARLKLLVYPNLAAADADVNRTGVGTLPGGQAKVELSAGASNVHLTGNISNRYTVRADGGGRYSARLVGAPAPWVVPVADQAAADAAVAVVSGDAESFRPVAEPGHSTVSLTILALLLAGSGFWLVRSRRGTATA